MLGVISDVSEPVPVKVVILKGQIKAIESENGCMIEKDDSVRVCKLFALELNHGYQASSHNLQGILNS